MTSSLKKTSKHAQFILAKMLVQGEQISIRTRHIDKAYLFRRSMWWRSICVSLLCEQPSSLEICRTNYQTYTSPATYILYLTQFNLNLNFGARPSFQSYSPQPPSNHHDSVKAKTKKVLPEFQHSSPEFPPFSSIFCNIFIFSYMELVGTTRFHIYRNIFKTIADLWVGHSKACRIGTPGEFVRELTS